MWHSKSNVAIEMENETSSVQQLMKTMWELQQNNAETRKQVEEFQAVQERIQ